MNPSVIRLLAAEPAPRLAAGLPGEARAAVGHPLVVTTPAGADRLGAALAAAGWIRKRHRWARFGDGTAEQLELVTAATLCLPGGAWERLLAAPGGLSLADELCLRALAASAHGPSVPASFRAACHRLAAADSGAWLRAHAIAGSAGERVVTLQDAYETGQPLGVRAGSAGPAWTGAVVALSGLDGAGKSTQAHLLAVALDALGYDVAVEWSRIGFSPGLQRLAAPVKRVATRLRPGGRAAALVTEAGAAPVADAGARRTVRRHRVVDTTWSVLVAGAEVSDARRRQARHATAARVVVRDRYLLDSVVHLADRYGGAAATAPARALLQRSLPAATSAFLLELPAEVAFDRKPGEWSRADLRRHADAYAAAATELGVVRVPADQPPHHLAATLAAAVWLRLP